MYGDEEKLRKPLTNEFNVLIDNKKFTLSISELDRKKSMPDCRVYTCMTFDADMVPYKRFTLMYNFFERSYWAWTGDVIRDNDRTFRNTIADLLNKGVIKLNS